MTNLNKYKTRYDADIAAANINIGDSDQVVADYYNAAGVTPDDEIQATREQLRGAIDVGEFRSLDVTARDAVRIVLLSDSVPLKGSNDRAIMLDAFAGKATTLGNFQTLQTQLETAAERSRASREGMLGNSKSVTAYDTEFMRLR